MLYISLGVIFILLFILNYSILLKMNSSKIGINNRVLQIKDINNVNYEEERDKSFNDRVVKPLYDLMISIILKATPRSSVDRLNKKLEKAGLLKNSTLEKWIYIRSMIVLLIPLMFGLLVFVIEPNIIKVLFLVIIMSLFIDRIFNFYLVSRIQRYKNMILKDLPYTLDLITVSVEAGLSFDGAMARVVNSIKGELCDEFAKALKEIRMGIERKIALRNMSERCDVRELSMLITSLIQADELGVSLGKILRIESANLREHRKQVAREKAMKAPIKMLFPLIFFIFPAIFIIILGPAVIKIFEIL